MKEIDLNEMVLPMEELPEYPTFVEGIRRAPKRESHLSQKDKELAVKMHSAIFPKNFIDRWQSSLQKN